MFVGRAKMGQKWAVLSRLRNALVLEKVAYLGQNRTFCNSFCAWWKLESRGFPTVPVVLGSGRCKWSKIAFEAMERIFPISP